MQLISYVDRLAKNLTALKTLLDQEFAGLFSGVHLLPFYERIDGEDAGFDPDDHTQVDQRLGDWSDVAKIGEHYDVMADLIVNHVSAGSSQFQDVLKKGPNSIYWDLFLKKSDIFSDDEQIKKIYRPRPTSPFTKVSLASGESYEFWTTFGANQIDINVESSQGLIYIDSILDKFTESGVKDVRLDAAGYAIKRQGTRCFMIPETYDFIGSLAEKCRQRGITTLVEIHSHYQTQIEIAARVGRVYDFAIPPLVLHTIFTKSTSALKKWLEISPRNCITVLDTHDGIGIVDVARDGDKDGLISDNEVDQLVEKIHQKSGQTSREASGEGSSNLDIYQVNCTFYDALGRDNTDYLIARAIQFFAPGEPQVYYAGLLASENDMALFAQTGVGRDVNRPYYSSDALLKNIKRPIVQSLMHLMSIRNTGSAFEGDFSVESNSENELGLSWHALNSSAKLHVDFDKGQAQIEIRQADELCVYDIRDGAFFHRDQQDVAL